MSDEITGDLFEYQVLAAAFRVPGAIKKFADELSPVDVGLIHGYAGIHEIYRHLVQYHKNIGTDVVDPIGFKSWLKDETEIMETLGGMSGVDNFIDDLMTIELSTVDSIIKLIEFRGNKRRQLDKIQELKTIISSKGQATDKDLEKISSLTDQIRALENDLDYDPLSSVRTAFDIGLDVESLWDMPNFLPTQYPALNKAIGYDALKGGYLRGTVNTIAALSGYGKSTLARCLCNHWLDQGETILFVNFEEPREHWERTLMTQVVKRNVYAEANSLSAAQKKELTLQFKEKMVEWGDRLMVRHDPDTLFFEDLEKWFRDILGRGVRKPTVVVIDTIQSMFTKSGGRARWGEFEQIMVSLEKLAKDMDAVFIITAQQNSSAIKEGREVINQADMGGSVTITQKSTIALFLTQMKDATGDNTFAENIMQCQITKNRITGTLYTANPPALRYNDAIKSYESVDFGAKMVNDNMEFELDEFGATY